MANVIGVDTALLTEVNLALEEAWSPNQQQIETGLNQTETVDMMLAKQKPLSQSMIIKMTDPEKDYDVKVHWLDFCGKEAQDCVTDVCQDIDLNQVEAIEKAYKIEKCIEDGFAVEDTKLATSLINKADFIRDNLNNMIIRLLRKWNQKHIAFLAANAGFNAGQLFNFVDGVTQVPEAQYNISLMPKIMQDMIYSMIPNGFIIDGGPLHLPYVDAKLGYGNGEGKGDAARSQLFDAQFDLLGFAKAGLADSSFLVAPYAYASVTKNYVQSKMPIFDPNLGETKGMYKYHIDIPKYGLKVDMFYQLQCVNGTKQRYKHVWLAKLHYDIFANPSGCDQGDGNMTTGIIQYQKYIAA